MSKVYRVPKEGWNIQRATTPPGEMLTEEFLKPLGISPAELAQEIGVSVELIDNLIEGKAQITTDLAERLSGRFGNSPEFWLNLQRGGNEGECRRTPQAGIGS